MRQLEPMYDLIFEDETLKNLFLSFHGTNWKKLTLQEKKGLITKMNSRVSELYNLDELKIKHINSKTPLYGSQSDYYWEISFNTYFLLQDCGYEVLDTYFHELRHSLQHRAIENRLTEKENIDQTLLEQWKRNFSLGNYFGGGSEFYMFQPVEHDAWRTGLLFARRVYTLNREVISEEDPTWGEYCDKHKNEIMNFVSDSESSKKLLDSKLKKIQEIYDSKQNDEDKLQLAREYVDKFLQKDLSKLDFEEVGILLSPYAFNRLNVENKVKLIKRYKDLVKVKAKRRFRIFENTLGSINIGTLRYTTDNSLTLVNAVISNVFSDIAQSIVDNKDVSYPLMDDKIKDELYLNMYRDDQNRAINFVRDTDNLLLFSLQPYARYESYYALERFHELKEIELKAYKGNCQDYKYWENFYNNDAIYRMTEKIIDDSFEEYYSSLLELYRRRIRNYESGKKR